MFELHKVMSTHYQEVSKLPDKVTQKLDDPNNSIDTGVDKIYAHLNSHPKRGLLDSLQILNHKSEVIKIIFPVVNSQLNRTLTEVDESGLPLPKGSQPSAKSSHSQRRDSFEDFDELDESVFEHQEIFKP